MFMNLLMNRNLVIIFVVASLFLGCFYKIYSLTSQLAAAHKQTALVESTLNMMIQEQANEHIRALKENAAKLDLANKQLSEVRKKANSDVARLKLNFEQDSQKIKELYETRIDSLNRNWTDRMRFESETNSNDSKDGVSSKPSNTDGFTGSAQECYRNYITLEKACQSTTIHFNQCRSQLDINCQAVGCASN